MAGILAVLRGTGHTSRRSKHKKLLEEGAEPVVEGVAFYVKYLGSCLVDSATGEEATGGAIKTITMMARKQDRKLERVALTISLRGIHMEPQGSDLEASTNFSIYRVSYCSTDTLAHTSSFAFIATNKNDTLECHAFLCPHRKMAQAATLTIAQAFNLAFKQWKEEQEKTAARAEGGEMVELVTQKPLAARPEEGGVQSEAPKQHETKRNETPASEGPSVAYHRKTEQISLGPAGRGGPGEGQLIVERRGRGEHHGPLLIDLSSLSPALAGVGERGPAEEEDMMMSFTQLAQRGSPLPMLRRLPPGAAAMDVGAFAGSPVATNPSPTRGSQAALWRIG